MNEDPSVPKSHGPTNPTLPSDRAIGASVLLAALANGVTLCSIGRVITTYEQYRRLADLTDSGRITLDVLVGSDVLFFVLTAGACLGTAMALFLHWAPRASWMMRIGFAAQWLITAVMLGLVIKAWLPFDIFPV